MKLVDLKPRFLRAPSERTRETVGGIEDAHGVQFQCPKCLSTDGHFIICWSRAAPAAMRPGPGRWILIGTSLEDLTLNAYPGTTRSVALIGGCAWHGYITNGEVTDA